MDELPLSCRCGTVRGRMHNVPGDTNTHVVCYCDDCQAFVRYLDRESDILDEYGGTEIVQTVPAWLTITQGSDQLRCLRLTPRGLYRWYTDCCRTPVANTVSAALPFAGVVHNFIAADSDIERWVGPARYRVQAKHARGRPPFNHVYAGFPLRSLLRIMPRLLLARLRGQQRPSPFYDDNGRPVIDPVILQPEQ